MRAPMAELIQSRFLRRLGACVLFLAAWAISPLETVTAQRPSVLVEVPEGAEGQRTFRVSIPWRRGVRFGSEPLRIGGDLAPVVPLLRWPDGSVRLEQAHVRLDLAEGRHLLQCSSSDEPPRPVAAKAFAFDGVSWLSTELEDPFGRVFTASFEDISGPNERARSTERIRVRRLRGRSLRRADDGIREVYLPVDALLVEWSDTPRVELTLVLRNDPEGAGADPFEPILGPVRLRGLTLIGRKPGLRALPHFGSALRMSGAERNEDGFHLPLLGPNDSLYLGDRTRKAFRIDLVATDGSSEAAIEEARSSVEKPWFAMPTLETTRESSAFGLFGGPAPVLPTEPVVGSTISTVRAAWAQLDRNPFGSFGEPRDGLRFGRLRCGPMALHQVLRAESQELLQLSELAVLQHGLRPGPGRAREPEETEAFRKGLPSRLRRRPHGYPPLDYEHLAHALLFDRFWLTGDPFARDELVRLADAAITLWQDPPFRTSRGEGRVAQVLASVASLDSAPETVHSALRDWARWFAHEIGPSLSRDRCIAFAQPADPRVLGPNDPFDAPFQIAELIRGIHSVRGQVEDPRLLALLTRAQTELALALAGPGWDAKARAPKAFVSSRDPARSFTARPHGPAADTGVLLIGAFAVSLGVVGSASERSSLAARADDLLGGESVRRDPVRRADRWLQTPLDRELGPR